MCFTFQAALALATRKLRAGREEKTAVDLKT